MTASGRSLPSKGSTSEPDSLAALRAENERLIALLEASGIEWRLAPELATSPSKPELSRLSTEAKVALFRRRFRGRTDVYPVRWARRMTGKSGYAPACANEWCAGVCEKPFRRSRVERGRSRLRRFVRRVRRPGCDRDFPLGKRGARLDLLHRACIGPGCASVGHCHHQPHLRAHPETETGVLRPPVSSSGHHAQGRLRQSDRLAAAEEGAGRRLHRVRRFRFAAASRPVGIPGIDPADVAAGHRAVDRAGHGRRASPRRDLYRR